MIRFKTKNHADVVMHDGIAQTLIKKMGASGTIPSALDHEMLAEAIEKLSQAAQQPSAQATPQQEAVSLYQRAQPLLELLRAALDNNDSVMWQKTNSF